MPKHKTVMFPPIYKLPNKFEEKIGHIIVAYAFLEHLLSQAIYGLLNISPKEGRLAVGEPSATERFDIVLDLMCLKKISLEVNVDDIKKTLEKVQKSRNNIAHRIWLEHPNTQETFLQLTKNSWRPDPKSKKIKRAVYPEGLKYGEPELDQLYKDIDKLAEKVMQMILELEPKFSCNKSANNP